MSGEIKIMQDMSREIQRLRRINAKLADALTDLVLNPLDRHCQEAGSAALQSATEKEEPT